MSSDRDFESAMKYISAIEGGANFNVVKGKPVLKEKSKNDTGGPTKYGITWGTLCRAYSQGIVAHADITQLTQEEARLIYKANYWTASKADRMKWGLCLVHFDTAVNSGVSGAGKLLQATLNRHRRPKDAGSHRQARGQRHYPGLPQNEKSSVPEDR